MGSNKQLQKYKRELVVQTVLKVSGSRDVWGVKVVERRDGGQHSTGSRSTRYMY